MEKENGIAYWQALKQGDKNALFSLYNAMYFHLTRFGLKLCGDDELVKDCVNQIFLNLWDNREKLPSVTKVKTYLFTVLRNLILDELSDKVKLGSALEKKLAQENHNELSYEEILIKVQNDEEIKEKLRNAIQKLTPKQIELIQLKFFEGLSYEQIAIRTSQSIKTSYNTIYDAVKSLKKLLS